MSHSHLFLGARFLATPLKNGMGRYVCQLQRITLKFCKEYGASGGVRDFIEHDLLAFARENPSVVVYLKPRRHRSPVLVAEFCTHCHCDVRGMKFSKDVRVIFASRSLQLGTKDTNAFACEGTLVNRVPPSDLQVGNLAISFCAGDVLEQSFLVNGERKWMSLHEFTRDEVVKYFELYKNCSDFADMRLRKMIQTANPSIQGPWTPFTHKDPKISCFTFPNETHYRARQPGPTATERVLEIYKQQRSRSQMPEENCPN